MGTCVPLYDNKINLDDENMTWRKGRNPLLYNSNLTPKPAYYGLQKGLHEASSAIDETL